MKPHLVFKNNWWFAYRFKGGCMPVSCGSTPLDAYNRGKEFFQL